MKQFAVDVDFRVTKRIYVDADNEEQAEQKVKRLCEDNPYQYTNAPDACTDYSITDVNECEDEEKTIVDFAVDYVREQLATDEIVEIRAQIDRSYRCHLSPSDFVTHIDKVESLLDEYGEDNDLPEGWWEEYDDIDDILMKI